MRYRLAVFTTLALAAAGTYVALDRLGLGDASDNDEYIFESSVLVSTDSLDEAVTWSDTVAVFTVVAERSLDSDSSEDEEVDVVVGRRVNVRLDDVIWRRGSGAQPPATFEVQAPGWYRDNDEALIPMRSESGIRVEVGKTYVAPITFIGEWGFDEVLEVVDGRIVAAPQQDSAFATALEGKTLKEAIPALNSAAPKPRSGPLSGTTEEQLKATGVTVG